jgi:hypothetical protein
MSPKDIENELLPIIEKNPGITLNGMFAYFKDRLNGKFPPMYNVVKALKDARTIKVDDKKKNTGHYLADVVISNEGAAKPAVTRTSNTPGDSSASFSTRVSRNRVDDKRYKLEKNEGAGWKAIDSNDIVEPITRLYEQCIRMVPLRYRVRDTQDDSIVIERKETANFVELAELANA